MILHFFISHSAHQSPPRARRRGRITNGHQYTLQVSGRGTQPALHFSFTSQDFGPCFLKTAVPAQAVLTIANRDENDIAFDIPWENKPHLEVCSQPGV